METNERMGEGPRPSEEAECCILRICCDETLRRQALGDKIRTDLDRRHIAIAPEVALAVAEEILDNYDLMRKGLLAPMVEFIATTAREYPYMKA